MKRSQPDDPLVKAIKALIRHDRPTSVQGRMQAWRTLEADPALYAFFSFVEHEGDEAWQEERARVGRTFIATTRDLPEEVRRGLNHLGAVRHLIPTWRRWGEELIADQSP